MTAPHAPISVARTCPQCDAAFSCGPGHDGRCWCDRLPAIMPVIDGAGCLCPNCLKRAVAHAIDTWVATLPADKSRHHEAMRFATPGELIEGIDYTVENGLYVFSTWYHLKRGACCHNGCRHCPFK